MMNVRWVIRSDMAEVLEIESSADRPLVEDEIVDILRKRNAIGILAENCGRVAGYAIYILTKNSIILHRLVVRPACRRRGVGASIVEKLISKLSPQRRRTIKVVVPESLLGTQMFFKAMGFRAIKVVSRQPEDGYLMVYRLGSGGDDVD